ncbi:MAG: hypothetical protein KDC84_13370 [Crocinitomicaceae bacterium]|nr:hypothetical protein [Crocinitomicaceae bacterium]
MAKIIHTNFLDTINSTIIEAEKRGVVRLTCSDKVWNGNEIHVNDQDMNNFGTCGYMALERHPKVIEKSKEFADKFGTQFSVSRSYLIDQNSVSLQTKVYQGSLNLSYKFSLCN